MLKNITKTPFKREFSAGCVVYKKLKVKSEKLKVVFLLGKHSGYHKWVLAKGLIEKKEKGWQTALRETEEEMGVRAKLVDKKPISKVQYVYYADYKQIKNSKHEARNPKQIQNSNEQISKQNQTTRRVEKYQESFDSAQDKGEKTKVFKTVSFYLAEFDSGEPKNHGWEMEEAGWFDYEQALELLAFKGEKEALKGASNYLQNYLSQHSLSSS